MGDILAEGPGFAILEAGALVTERGGATSIDNYDQIGHIISVDAGPTNSRIMQWGNDNCLPSYRERLVADNNIVPSLIRTRRNITLGRGLMAYRKIIRNGEMVNEEVSMPDYAQEFFERSEIDKYLEIAANQDAMHSAIPTEYIRYRGGDKTIKRIHALECRHVRLGEMNARGKVEQMFWKGNWSKNVKRGSIHLNLPAQSIPMYLRDRKQAKFGTFAMDRLLCLDEYYPAPYWWGGEEWIRLANKIPQFHDANLKHGFSMRWHIEVPKDYFHNARANWVDEDKEKKAKEAATEAKREFLRKINETLQGLSNAGKTVVTEYDVDKAVNQMYPGIKITPLNYDLKDEALLKLFDASNAANMSGQGVHPVLANIQTQGKLSSGSEIRNAYLMYVAIHTPLVRRRILKPIEIVKYENGWDKDIHFGFRDMLLTNLDEDKSGQRETDETAA